MNNCRRLLLISLLSLLIISCKKKAIEIYPSLVGTWQPNLAYSDPCSSKSFTITEDGYGYYYGGYSDLEITKFEGTAKIKDEVLYIKGNEICEVFNVIDTVGYLPNPGYCYSEQDQDSVKFTGLLTSDYHSTLPPADNKWYRFEFNW